MKFFTYAYLIGTSHIKEKVNVDTPRHSLKDSNASLKV
jgi:hypothetical protein